MFARIPLPLKLFGLGVGTLTFLLTAYLYLIPLFGNTFPIKPLVLAAIAACFTASAVLSFQASPPGRTAFLRALGAFGISVSITVAVFILYLAIATVLRGA